MFNPNRFRPDPKPEKKEKAKPKRIKPRSNKRAEQEKIYDAIRPVFLKDKICPVTGEPATQVHHKKGRIGNLLIDVRYFLGVSDRGHKKIEAEPEWAKKMGYSLERLKNDDAENENRTPAGHDDARGGESNTQELG